MRMHPGTRRAQALPRRAADCWGEPHLALTGFCVAAEVLLAVEDMEQGHRLSSSFAKTVTQQPGSLPQRTSPSSPPPPPPETSQWPGSPRPSQGAGGLAQAHPAPAARADGRAAWPRARRLQGSNRFPFEQWRVATFTQVPNCFAFCTRFGGYPGAL